MSFNRKELVELLTGRVMPDDELFFQARSTRASLFGDAIVVRGVIEITNRCRVNCTFCPMRRDNIVHNSGYLLDEQTILAAVCAIRDSGINVVFIQGGEISQTTRLVERVAPSILSLYDNAAEILLNLGNKPFAEYSRLKSAGASSYILKHETANPDLYQTLKFESLDSRLRCISDLLSLGFKVGTGSIIGLPGQTVEDIADDLLLAKTLRTHMVSVSPFVPAPNTPLSSGLPGSLRLTLRTIAITRLMMPDVLIPSVSALEANMPGGQSAGLGAGANVMTVNFTPEQRRSNYLIYGANRYVVGLQHVRQLLKDNGLTMRYSTWAPMPKLPIN